MTFNFKQIPVKIKQKIDKFNDYLADRLSYVLSIMLTFYIISLLVTIPLFFSHPSSFVGWASYLCSVIFQGVALPVLGYTSRKAGEKSDKAIERIEYVVNLIEKKQQEMDGDIDKIIDMEEEEMRELVNDENNVYKFEDDFNESE